jgi:hypothetical protein
VSGACQSHSLERDGIARTKRAGTNFFAQSVLSADAEVESMRRSVGHWMLARSAGADVSQNSTKVGEREGKGKEEWIIGSDGGSEGKRKRIVVIKKATEVAASGSSGGRHDYADGGDCASEASRRVEWVTGGRAGSTLGEERVDWEEGWSRGS